MPATAIRPLRRADGEGSPSIDPRTGRHLFRSRTMVPGRLITGRGDTAREAKANARERAAHILAGRPSGKPETFGEMLQAWLSLEAEPNYSIDTFRSYRTPVTGWLLRKPLRDLPAEQLRPSHLQTLYQTALAEGASRRTLEGIRLSASLAIKWAISDGRMAGYPPGSQWNPAATARFPKGTPARGSRPAPDPAAVESFLRVADPHPNGAIWRIMAETSSRPSEAAGIRWSDIDWDAERIRFRGALRLDERIGEYRWNAGLKNGAAGERDILIGPELITLLHSHRTASRERQLSAVWDSDAWAADLIFRKPLDGRALDFRHLTRLHKMIMAAAGEIEWFTPYQLRHHLPTRMAANGVPLSVTADLLGIDERTARQWYIDRPETVVDYRIIREALGR